MKSSRVVLAHYRYLQTPVPADGDRTSGQVFELIGNGFVTSGIDGTAASLSHLWMSKHKAHVSALYS